MAPIIRKTPTLLRGDTADLVLQLKREALQDFLRKHGFEHVGSPRELGRELGEGKMMTRAAIRMERIYPIHVAAEVGDDETLLMLLEEGADPEESTSQGRTALDIAQDANVDGSHLHVLGLLRRAVQIHMVSL